MSCTEQRAPYRTDLAAMFERVEMEAGVDGFVADILLSSSTSGARMLLEIAVTHPCDETKISSGLPIIEINIRSENAANRLRDGIDAASSCTLSHNLPSPDAAPHLCTTPCPATVLAVLLYENGSLVFGTGDRNRERGTDPVRSAPRDAYDCRCSARASDKAVENGPRASGRFHDPASLRVWSVCQILPALPEQRRTRERSRRLLRRQGPRGLDVVKCDRLHRL